MPVITEKTVPVWVFCPDAVCPGYKTEPMEGLLREVGTTNFEEAGPEAAGGNAVCTSTIRYFVPSGETDEHGYHVEAQLPCPHCDMDRQVSGSERPRYPRSTPMDPEELVHRRTRDDRLRDAELAHTRQSSEVSELKAQIAELTALVAQQQEQPKPKAKA